MTVPSLHDASDLAATVSRAMALFDAGDVEAAHMLASAAYDQAKAVAGYAKRFRAAEGLVDKARRLQGDALLIEARAKMRLAADYDAAQAAGYVRKPGQRGKAIPDGNGISPPTAEEIGLAPKDVHEARKLAEAERRAPGLVERAIAARLAAGLEPSRANLRAAVGTDSASAAERGNNLYETPIEAMRTLLALEAFTRRVYEPACGRGAIVRPLEAAGYDVALSDLVDYGTATRDGECQGVADFLATKQADGAYDIVTNPPYGPQLNAFVAHALREHRPRKMALLLNLNFLCGFDDSDRCFAMDDNPPARILVFTRRLPMMHRDGWDGPVAESRMNCAWFVWVLRPPSSEGPVDLPGGAEARSHSVGPDGLTYGGPTEIYRVDWKAFEHAPALAPLSAAPPAVAASPAAKRKRKAVAA